MNKITRSAWSRLKRGFTLVELVIVIAVIAVLAAVLVPTFITVIDNANNSADLQLTASANTILSTDLSADSTATVENLRKLLKDNGITDLTTKNKDNVILYNKEAKKFELKKLNDKTAIGVKDPEASAGTAKTVAADNGDLQVDFAAYCPEEIFAGYILVSTGGNPLSEGLYKLHNWETTPTESSDILKNVCKINTNISSTLRTIVSQTLYVAKDGGMFRLSIDDSGAVKPTSTQALKKVVFHEEYSELSLKDLADNIDGAVTVVIPQTVTGIKEETLDTDSLANVLVAGNTDIVESAEVEDSGVTVADDPLSEIYETIAKDDGLMANKIFSVSTSKTSDYYYSSLSEALAFATQSHQLSNTDKIVKFVVDEATADKLSYEIDGDITIPKGITLLLPYDTSKNADRGVGASGTGTKEYEAGIDGTTQLNKHTAARGNSDLCDLTVTVAEGKKITVNGSLKIGGITSGGSGTGASETAQNITYYNGQTCSGYARLVLGKNAVIESNGVIESYGFIEEESTNNGSQVILNSGSIQMPFIVREHRGGSSFLQMVGGWAAVLSPDPASALQTSPFNRFFMENVHAELTVSYGAKVLGAANLYANGSDNRATITLIGADENSLVQLETGAKAIAKFNTTSSVIDLNIKGSMKLNALSLRVVSVNMHTKAVHLPVSWYYNITLSPFEDGTEAVVDATAQKLKMLPGSSLTVLQGVTLEASELVVYDKDVFATIYDSCGDYEKKGEEANLTVIGTVIAKKLAGAVNGADGAKLQITEATTIVTKEVAYSNGSTVKYTDDITTNLSFVSGTPDGVGTYTFTNGAWTKQTA